jgi:hypothetical protein
MERPMNLKELQALWEKRDMLYAGLGSEASPSGRVDQTPKSRPGPLSTTEIAAIKLGRTNEVNMLEIGERAAGWAIVKTWVPPLAYGVSPLDGWL